jgi:hypothetical protein
VDPGGRFFGAGLDLGRGQLSRVGHGPGGLFCCDRSGTLSPCSREHGLVGGSGDGSGDQFQGL